MILDINIILLQNQASATSYYLSHDQFLGIYVFDILGFRVVEGKVAGFAFLNIQLQSGASFDVFGREPVPFGCTSCYLDLEQWLADKISYSKIPASLKSFL